MRRRGTPADPGTAVVGPSGISAAVAVARRGSTETDGSAVLAD